MTSESTEPPAISYVREFLRGFNPSTKPTRDSIDSGLPWIRAEGLLSPTREERAKYRELLVRLHRQVAVREDISLAALDRAAQTAVFRVADLARTGTRRRRDRVRDAAEELEAFVHRPARDFVIGIQVRGIDVATIPFEFGRVRFERMSQAYAQIVEVRSPATVDDSGSSSPDDNDESNSDHDAIIGSLTIRARDDKAAETLGEREVRETVECLNLFLAHVPSFSSPLYVLTERSGASFFDRLIWDSDGKDSSYSHAPSPDLFAIGAVRDSQGPALDRVEQLLKSSRRTEVEELLLQGMRWGGRALAAHTAEDSIAFAFTALECVLVPCGKDDIVKRLSARVAWAASDAESGRKEVLKEIKDAYDLRSRIVHDGRIEVSERDRNWVNGVMRYVLLKSLMNRDIAELATAQHLEEYLRRETREAGPGQECRTHA
ncbi:MAG: HEPN domain-containing protein [Chloroflexota bacterium]|nr:HEPN domain-containing protein [Chloroflexota bacterium]